MSFLSFKCCISFYNTPPFIKKLNDLPHIKANTIQDGAGRDIYRAEVLIEQNNNYSAKEIVYELQNGLPAIYTRNYQLNNNIIEFDIRSVDTNEMNQIIDRLKSIVD